MDFRLLATTLLLSVPAAAEPLSDISKEESDDQAFSVNVEYSPWLATWEQTSTAAARFGSDAIDVDYAIDSSVAQSVKLGVSLYDFGYTLENIQVPESGDLGNKALSYLSMGINYTGITNTEFEYRLLKASFKGYIDGSYQGRSGVGSFETDTNMHDFAVVFSSGLGVGYRYFSYDVPQDVYLVNSSQPSSALVQGFVDMEYTAHYLTALYRENDLFSTAQSSQYALALNMRMGVGKIEPGGDFLDATERTLKQNNLMENGDRLMDDGKTWFYDLDLNGYKRLHLGSSLSGAVGLGYRASYMKSSFSETGDYSLVADFETVFHGPYMRIQIGY